MHSLQGGCPCRQCPDFEHTSFAQHSVTNNNGTHLIRKPGQLYDEFVTRHSICPMIRRICTQHATCIVYSLSKAERTVKSQTCRSNTGRTEPVRGGQPISDISYKPSSRQLLLAARSWPGRTASYSP